MAIKIEMLRCFHAVVDHGNLAHAAESLGRTPSAVSMMLKQFEDHIGAPLFEKGRKARLTALGQMIHTEARRELAHFDKSVKMIDALARSQAGLVRLAATPTAAHTVLPPLIEKFSSQHPDVRIDMRDMDSGAVLQAMQADEADIGIASLPETEGFERWSLFEDPFGIVCRADHPLAKDWHKLNWADVAPHRFIANGLCDAITDKAFAPILESAVMMVPTTISLLALVNAGVGVTLLPERALPPMYSDLVFLPLKDTTAVRKLDVITQPTHQMTPAGLSFSTLLKGG